MKLQSPYSFKPEAFVPHRVTSGNDQATQVSERIIIDWQGHTNAYHDVIINLQQAIPEEFSRFNKLSEIVVQDEKLEEACEAIKKAAYTGKIGDGKIFVMPLDQVQRIRTGETGEDAL